MVLFSVSDLIVLCQPKAQIAQAKQGALKGNTLFPSVLLAPFNLGQSELGGATPQNLPAEESPDGQVDDDYQLCN